MEVGVNKDNMYALVTATSNKNVFIVLGAFGSDAVVLSHLVSLVHTSHVLVVQHYRVSALHRDSGAIFLLSLCSACDVCLGKSGQHVDRFLVHPDRRHKVASLTKEVLPPLQGDLFQGVGEASPQWPCRPTGIEVSCEQSVEEVAGDKIVITIQLVVTTPQMLTQLQDDSLPQTDLSGCAVSWLPNIDVKVTKIARDRICPHPHLEAPLHRLHGHVLLHRRPA